MTTPAVPQRRKRAENYLDFPYWQQLAGRYSLPHDDRAITDVELTKWLKRYSLTLPRFLRAAGCKTLEEFIELNPRMPLGAAVGFALEHADHE